MGVSDWIISISAGAIGILIGLVTYFAQKWFDSIEKTIEKHSSNIDSLSEQISSLKSQQSAQAESVAKTVHTELAAVRFPHSKIEEVREETKLISRFIQERIVPQIDKQAETFGRVVLLDEQIKEQNNKLVTMFNALKILVAQKQKDQK